MAAITSASEASAVLPTWQLAVVTFVIASLVYHHGRWIGWIFFTLTLFSLQALYIAYQGFAILSTVALASGLSTCARFAAVYEASARWLRGGSIRRRYRLRRQMADAPTYEAYERLALELDALDGKDDWRSKPCTTFNHQTVASTSAQLKETREAADAEGLARLLRAVMHRNHLNVDDAELHNNCRVGTKTAIADFVREQIAAIQFLRSCEDPRLPMAAKVDLLQRCSICLGHTALCLSGGGALAMYHMGVVKALIENDALPMVVSGTSGGSIVAGVLAVHTNEEMIRDIVQDDIAVRYPERWFPSTKQQLINYLRSGTLVQNDDFAACTKAYYGDITFEEAFNKTGRIVNINISSSSRAEGSSRGALLLNHLTAPHVLIRSAVHASCCLPTVMLPTSLLAKDSAGNIVSFAQQDVRWIDGSFTADIPHRRLSELFHVTQSIVSQVNPHIAATFSSHTAKVHGSFRRFESALAEDVLHRLRHLAKLRMLPAIYGADIKQAVKQRYSGNVTILPPLGGPTAFLRMVQNPDKKMMHTYITKGQAAAFKNLSHIKHLLAVEQELNLSLESLLGSSGRSPLSTPSPFPSPTPARRVSRQGSFTKLDDAAALSNGHEAVVVLSNDKNKREAPTKEGRTRTASNSNGAWSETLLQQQLESLLAKGPVGFSSKEQDDETGDAPDEQMGSLELSEISETYEKRHKLLLSRNLINNKAIDALAEEKEQLHNAFLQQSEELRAADEALKAARDRISELEVAVRAIHAQTESSLSKLALSRRNH